MKATPSCPDYKNRKPARQLIQPGHNYKKAPAGLMPAGADAVIVRLIQVPADKKSVLLLI
jgi:hypothetical protein